MRCRFRCGRLRLLALWKERNGGLFSLAKYVLLYLGIVHWVACIYWAVTEPSATACGVASLQWAVCDEVVTHGALGDIIRKIIDSRYYGIFQVISKLWVTDT